MKSLFSYVLFVLLSHVSSAQTLWKKDITRLIPFIETKTKSPKGLLVEDLVYAAINGKIQAYSNTEAYLNYKISSTQVKAVIIGKSDTITVVDPLTGKEKMVITDRIFNPEVVDKYKLHEEWSFNLKSFQTNIRIVGIAPVVDIYSETGIHRGTQPMMWFKYTDITAILSNHAKTNSQENLANIIWKDDLEKNISKPITGTQSDMRKALVCRTIDISEPDDTVNYHLRDISYDTTYIERIMNGVKNGTIKAYENETNNFGAALSTETFNNIFISKPDTVMVEDPVSRTELIKIVRREFDPYRITKYMLLEEWTFDAKQGDATIQIKGIAPLIDVYKEDGSLKETKTMFWIHFNDFAPLLPAYEIYHPQHTFADLVWQSYFQAPEYIH